MVEVLNNYYEMFDLLPDEIVANTLIFVDADTLTSCRLVCKRWQTLIDTYIFQNKASQENKFVNNGRGYHSFLNIRSNDVGKLELPWYVFYVICKYDPFNRNLVKNHCGQDRQKHWKFLNDFPEYGQQHRITNLWTVEQIRQSDFLLINDPNFNGHTSCFRSNGSNHSKNQNIKFKDYGLNDTIMKTLQPEIEFSAWYYHGCHVQSSYYVQALLRNRSKQIVDSHHVWKELMPDKKNLWDKISFSFKIKGNESSMNLSHFIHSQEYLLHPYYSDSNFKITCSVVKILLPLKFKSTESKIHI